VYFMSAEEYFAQQAAYNLTIQHTVAASMEGVEPGQVTPIVVKAIASPSARSMRAQISATTTAAVVVKTCSLAYKVTVYDPVKPIEELKRQLVHAAATGKMDEDLRHYAAVFGATQLENGTFTEPLFTDTAVQRSASEKLTGAQIACLIIGIFLFLALLVTCVLFVMSSYHRDKSSNSAGASPARAPAAARTATMEP
jgi:hypothetical protein